MDNVLPVKHEVKCSGEFLTALFNLPEGFEIFNIINNGDKTFSIIIHKQGEELQHSYLILPSHTKLHIARTETCNYRDLFVWEDWDIN